jgi:hypothetical protein
MSDKDNATSEFEPISQEADDRKPRSPARRPWQTPCVTVSEVAATENGAIPPVDGPAPYS